MPANRRGPVFASSIQSLLALQFDSGAHRIERDDFPVVEAGQDFNLVTETSPGARFGDQVEILAGLDDGEVIALDPVRAGIELKRQQALDR